MHRYWITGDCCAQGTCSMRIAKLICWFHFYMCVRGMPHYMAAMLDNRYTPESVTVGVQLAYPACVDVGLTPI